MSLIKSAFTRRGHVFNTVASGIQLTKISGLDSADIRDSRILKPGAHGETTYDAFFSGRTISFNGYFWSMDENIVPLEETIKDIFALSSDEEALDFQRAGQVARTVFARAIEPLRIMEEIGTPCQREFFGVFRAGDPREYSQAEHSTNVFLPTAAGGFSFPLSFPLAFGTVSTGGIATINNAGNIETYPVITIYGPVDTPILENYTAGKLLKFNLSVAAGDYLVIDFKAKTVKLNGTASRMTALASGWSWWNLAPGNNEFHYRASTYEAASYARVTWRDAWM